ncbi:hypothetical protein CPB84DRAFT_1791070 [Gymnopilus junonius]|uniref:SET domain-containing protein n=1 Tax=Gymnopilus junonius TaxID=109634 RepID=A0A9P5NCL2_GYMJU|nr:hypothetical protein CPB84DRAFT_1791070 [Gymnopilus junonius]
METCTLGGRLYSLHTISLPPSKEDASQTSISCLLDPDLIPLLPDPLPCASNPNDASLIAVRQTPHKGHAMFAARDIEPGQLIIVEHPALILPSGKFPKEVYDELAARLPEKRRKDLFAMANSRSKESLDLKGRIDEERREIYGGVYPLINRANHSCSPNAGTKWDLASLTMSFYALRHIPAGEEICKTYINPALPRETRMGILRKNYRFTCDCPWCDIRQSAHLNLPEPEEFTPEELDRIAASDRDRATLGTWVFTHPGYKKWSTDLARADDLVISSHLEALSLIDKEGMQGLQNLFVEEIAMCYAILAKVVKLTRVEDPDLQRRFEDWLVDPERRMKKWAWRKRQREQLSKRKDHDDAVIEDVDAFQFLFQYNSD